MNRVDNITVDVVGKICRALDCTPNDIMEFVDNASSRGDEAVSENLEESPKGATLGLLLILLVVLMTCIFSTLDNAITLSHVAGTMDIGQWPRIFLAFSGLIAGCLLYTSPSPRDS